ncbi:Ankyrin repeat-containing domain protein [Rutstroemia sp. NJR-2017a BBW]|nr:Ankyrin repeat-containing domain protein [Rutstroemia sp. NJR-2017a BBW]
MEVVGAVSNIAGIVSVGIQVCEGLVNYYNAWKGSKKENSTMIQSIESLLDCLSLLKRALESPAFDETLVINVESKILDCEESINELHDELRKIMVCKLSGVAQDASIERKDNANPSIKDKMAEQGRRLLYPFRKSTLMRIQESIEHVRINLVLSMDTLNLSTVSRTAEKVFDISKKITNINDGVNTMMNQQVDKEGIEMLKWLFSWDCHSEQREVSSRRQPSTGEWIFKSPEFQHWIDGEKRFLWCSGSPGVGKTVLTSAIVDYLQGKFPSSDVAIAFIYCNYAEKRSLTEYITSIIQQILRQQYTIPDYVLELYRKHQSMRTKLNRTEGSELLRSLAHSISGLYLVVDALDECQDSKKTRSDLIGELRSLSPNTRVLCTSRRLGDIEEKLSDAPHLEIQASDADVRAYLGAKVDSEENIVRFCKRDPTLRATIIEKVAAKANGMFLLAHLHIEAIACELKISRVRKALVDLPEVLAQSYDEALKRVSECQDTNRRDLAMNILMWLSCTKRPLTIRELQHALVIMELDADENELDEDDFYEQDLLLTVCAGLVVLDPETTIIRLCHYTTQEYFDKRQTELFSGAHVSISRACIRYLSLVFKGEEEFDRAQVTQRVKSNPFVRYASRYWDLHTQGSVETELKRIILTFLEDEMLVRNAFTAMGLYPHLSRKFPAITSAARFGLSVIVEEMLQSGADIEATTYFAMTPLMIAVHHGHASVVSKLISAKANLCAQDEFGKNALHIATVCGHIEVAKQLIDAEPLLINGDLSMCRGGESPLTLAIKNCNEDIVKLLVSAGADVNTRDNTGRTPLGCASLNNLPRIVDLLVSKGANLDAKDLRGYTPLAIAAVLGSTEALKRLLEAGAEVNSGEYHPFTPLACAARSGHRDKFNILIKYGADARILWSQSAYVNPEFLHNLLEAGAEVDAVDKVGRTALHRAAEEGREDKVKVLLAWGPDVHLRTKEGKTALDLASMDANRGPHVKVIDLLMEAERRNDFLAHVG